MNANANNRGAMSVNEFCQWASIGRSKFYEENAAGRLKVRKIGRKTLVTMFDAQAWLAALPEYLPEAALCGDEDGLEPVRGSNSPTTLAKGPHNLSAPDPRGAFCPRRQNGACAPDSTMLGEAYRVQTFAAIRLRPSDVA